MIELTGRERLTRLFQKKPIDRVPIWLLTPVRPLSCYTDIWNQPSYKPLMPYIDKYCVQLDRNSLPCGFCYNANPEITYKNETIIEGEDTITRNWVHMGDELSIYKEVRRGPWGSIIKPMVQDPELLDKIIDFPYVPPRPVYPDYEKDRAKQGDKGLIMMGQGDPLAPLYSLCDVGDFAMWTILEKKRITRFLDEMNRRCLEHYKYLLEEGIGEVYFIVGSEFAGPPLVSPAQFNEMSAKYVKGIIDLIREYGKYSIVHYHGNLGTILDGMRYMHPDGLHTIEEPPIGNCPLPIARKALDDTILIGSLQYDELFRLSEEEIAAEAKRMINEGTKNNGRFILSTTAGPYEDYMPEKAINNYISFVKVGLQYGKYL